VALVAINLVKRQRARAGGDFQKSFFSQRSHTLVCCHRTRQDANGNETLSNAHNLFA
jgi:hypothetical protein